MNETVSRAYDLEQRTGTFGGNIILLCKSLHKDVVSTPLISQIVRSGTSIGANYMEANGASSKKDFIHKIHICKKEAQETKHWLHMLSINNPDKVDEIKELGVECQELILIFGKIAANSKNKDS